MIRRWRVAKPDEELAAEFSRKCDLSPLALKVMTARGYTDFERIVEFFKPAELSDPFLIEDMQRAVNIISRAIDEGELICVYGDYDCDGVTATAILYSYLNNMGASVMYYIPERSDGYGMNIVAVERLAEQGVRLIVTVDNGITAHKETERAYELGMRVIVTDHHQPLATLPRAEAVVNPHRRDCRSTYKDLAGAGVAFKLCAALDGGYEAVLEQYADICALGTVADIVPLTSENRTIVSKGLLYMRNTENLGLNMLMDKAKVNRDRLNSTAIAFQLAPRINASGRFGSPITAVQALLAEDEEDAEKCADILMTLNSMRKETEAEITKEITDYINDNPELLYQRMLVLSGKGWHHGVIGIVSARILELFGKPNVIISFDENGLGRGSARSIKGFNIFECFSSAADLLEQFGGHECAGGLTVKEENLDALRQRLYDYANKRESMALSEISCDMIISPDDMTVENIEGLRSIEPFGEGNRQPVFAFHRARVEAVVPMSQGKHTRLDISYGSARLKAPLFNQSPNEIMYRAGDLIDIVCTLEIDEYNGNKSICARAKEIRPIGIKQEKYFAARDCYERFKRGERLSVSLLQRMKPERADLVLIYRYIGRYGEISADELFMRINSPEINYGKLRLAIDAFCETGLASFVPAAQRVKLLPVVGKVRLDKAPTLETLENSIKGGF